MARKKALTPKQAAFVREYLIDLNATQAARRAGYSERAAEVQGCRLLSNAKVQTAIQQALKSREKRTEITQDRVLRELAKLAFSDMRSFARWNGDSITLNDSEVLSDDEAACVAELSQTTTEHGGSIRFKLHDKRAALELLGKHLGIFVDRIDLTGNLEITVQLPEDLSVPGGAEGLNGGTG